jgi:hypothetical protein
MEAERRPYEGSKARVPLGVRLTQPLCDKLRGGATEPEVKEAEVPEQGPRKRQQSKTFGSEPSDNVGDDRETDERRYELPSQIEQRVAGEGATADLTDMRALNVGRRRSICSPARREQEPNLESPRPAGPPAADRA